MADRAAPPVSWAVTPRGLMSGELYGEVVALCTLAYDEDFTALMATFHGSVHVLGSQAGRVVSHALWVTRWLQAGSRMRRCRPLSSRPWQPGLTVSGKALAAV